MIKFFLKRHSRRFDKLALISLLMAMPKLANGRASTPTLSSPVEPNLGAAFLDVKIGMSFAQALDILQHHGYRADAQGRIVHLSTLSDGRSVTATAYKIIPLRADRADGSYRPFSDQACPYSSDVQLWNAATNEEGGGDDEYVQLCGTFVPGFENNEMSLLRSIKVLAIRVVKERATFDRGKTLWEEAHEKYKLYPSEGLFYVLVLNIPRSGTFGGKWWDVELDIVDNRYADAVMVPVVAKALAIGGPPRKPDF